MKLSPKQLAAKAGVTDKVLRRRLRAAAKAGRLPDTIEHAKGERWEFDPDEAEAILEALKPVEAEEEEEPVEA